MSFLSNFSLFQKARLKLTFWYLLILIIITSAFSVGIYRLMTAELNRFEEMQKHKLEIRMQFDPYVRELPSEARDILRQRMLDNEVIDEVKKRIQLLLIFINLGILAGSAAAAYFLAGKTLKPIQEMVDEQNRFITDSSHELRTPLTALRSEMEVTLRDKKLTLKDSKEIIKSNLEEVISIQRLTENLLTLTKSFNKNHKKIEKVEVADIIREATKKVSSLAKQKNISVDPSTDSAAIQGNKNELTDLVVIFLDNAIKYSNSDTKIEIFEKKKGSMIEIQIKDEGIGIDPKDIPHLFERFYRADKSRTKNDSEGFGLGLSIAKRIIDSYNGTATVVSKPEKGSTFIINLPVK
jgi:two-component system, OmpR family, sensor histidine kinase CiaH